MYLKVNVDVEWGLVCCDLIRKDLILLCQDKAQVKIAVDSIQLLCQQHYTKWLKPSSLIVIDTRAR